MTKSTITWSPKHSNNVEVIILTYRDSNHSFAKIVGALIIKVESFSEMALVDFNQVSKLGLLNLIWIFAKTCCHISLTGVFKKKSLLTRINGFAVYRL